MIPSVLAKQIRQGLTDFLHTTFPISTPFFQGLLHRLLEQEETVFKGPYLSIGLPFRKAGAGPDFFPDVPLPYKPYRHQEEAFKRLSGEQNPRSTLVATGTGSGKTECFLWPILDYCYKRRGEPGIKAILIYPMNALATDQAARIARAIFNNPRLKGNVTAGIYIGQSEKHPSKVMGPDGIMADKDTLRLMPPDILLTNYKMLDYLLVRPGDYGLWRQNRPETLRYLVVDELHTFDGAQGTDLACLIRRLKARLKTPQNYLCCVGTSATLGSREEQEDLLDYARLLFGEPFTQDAIIHESRLTTGEFLGDSLISTVEVVPQGKAPLLDPEAYNSLKDYVRSQFELWFGESVSESAPDDPQWQIELGRRLKGHLFFHNLLKVVAEGVTSYDRIFSELERVTPSFKDAPHQYKVNLLNSLLALVSVARNRNPASPENPLPFLHVRLQFWMRELRRMVCSVSKRPELRFADDLGEEQLKRHLPLVHCRECGSTGWAALLRHGDNKINPDLQTFYSAFFNENPDVAFLFPEPDKKKDTSLRGAKAQICASCLHISPGRERGECASCGHTELIPIFIPDMKRRVTGNNRTRLIADHNCPYCQSKNSLTIMGSRAASLASVQIAQIFASYFNDDKKLVTFSDSVQDAAHRAGFFTARTWRFSLRTAIQKVLLDTDREIFLSDLPDLFVNYWSERFDEETFVATFIASNMLWFHDFEYLKQHGKLPGDSRLKQDIIKRLSWEIFSEYGFSARIGRTLEKTGSSVAHLDSRLFERLVAVCWETLRNEVGELRGLKEETLRRFITGLVMHLKNRGAVMHKVLDSYLENWGKTYLISQKHIPWMPNFGPVTRAPAFLTTRCGTERFDALLTGNPGNRTWYEGWVEKCLQECHPLAASLSGRIYDVLLNLLVKSGVLEERIVRAGKSPHRIWGLLPDALSIGKETVQFRCRQCGHLIPVAEGESHVWHDAPCLRLHCKGTYEKYDAGRDYYAQLYACGHVERIFAAEHTGLLKREEREELEQMFKEDTNRRPWYPNLLSCTPTLELGIDIGDLSSLILCSVPPAQANYLQRIGRAGRRDGNALNLTLANARHHDLYFFSEPEEMIAGKVESPGIFLNASAVLERQLTAYGFDRWIESGITESAIPGRLGTVLNNLTASDRRKFPFNYLLFIETHGMQILHDFLSMFKEILTSDAAEHLRIFMQGDHKDEGSLAYKILNGLYQCQRERESLKKKVRSLNSKLRQKQKTLAKDKNYEEEIEELRREKSALQALVKNINERDTLNFFTDEGLIPNYAFPEAGVLLKSVIYRRKKVSLEGQGRYDTWSYEYERPAANALGELAPENTFYAGGRQVRIDQIDLVVSEIETWRFCNNCSHSEREAEVEAKDACPRCGSPLWADAGQKRQMVRMRQVFAHTPDRDSRISDDSDDRKPKFYTRQMLVDCDYKNVEAAYSVASDELPFGFEFLSKATFREINFGEKDGFGEEITIAGLELPRKGFTICKFCGKIQNRRGNVKHALTCSARRPDSKANFTDCVYLYREFTSEAIRILLPVTDFWDSERKIHSFVAALQLGLKERFQGGVEHLQVTAYDEPLPESGLRKKYLVLYDKIPGGTGYLKDLMRSKRPLMEVMQKALDILKACSCHRDVHKDGCYRCLYAYRSSHYLDKTSRDTAIELLSSILKYKDKLEKVENLSKVCINSLLDSELEARFLEALRRLNAGELRVSLDKHIVRGKPGYLLKIGKMAWYVEPQAELGPSDGVTIRSIADFLFRPAREQDDILPIAVFTDGYAYHRERIGVDMSQRMALAQSGRYRVWYLTWKDVETQFKSLGDYYVNSFDLFNLPTGDKYRNFIQGYQLDRLKSAHTQNSFELLAKFLLDPDEHLWRRYAFVLGLMHIDYARFKGEKERIEWSDGLKQALPDDMVNAFEELDCERLYGHLSHPSSDQPLLNLWVCVEKDAVKVPSPGIGGMAVGCCLNDANELDIEGGFERLWNGYLRLYNLFQFIPTAFFITTTGVKANSYQQLRLKKYVSTSLALPAEEISLWNEAKELTDSELHDLLDLLAAKGWSPPEAGYELVDDKGTVIAQAELGWEELKIAVPGENDIESMAVFEREGWKTISFKQAVSRPEAVAALAT